MSDADGGSCCPNATPREMISNETDEPHPRCRLLAAGGLNRPHFSRV
jgi:hypothetical protein